LESGMTEEEAKSKVWLVDSKGLVSHARGDTLAEHKLYFARNDISVAQAPKVSDLQSVLELVQPTILIGLSTVGGSFTPSIIEYMGSINDKPIIMPLSNPLTKAECTFEEALTYTQGRAIFASGSPFPPHQYQGVEYLAGQGNNMYIFPGLGLGSILGKCSRVTESMIMAASTALANSVTDQETKIPDTHDLEAWIINQMYDPFKV
ncbi:malic enzyme, NAD binding domain-containing protein, partial [Globomyces pollinis-pini]